VIGQQNLGFRFGDQMLIYGESRESVGCKLKALVVVSFSAGLFPRRSLRWKAVISSSQRGGDYAIRKSDKVLAKEGPCGLELQMVGSWGEWEASAAENGHCTVKQLPNRSAARKALSGLLREINCPDRRLNIAPITLAELTDHYRQRELIQDNGWKAYSTRYAYEGYLRKWILPRWGAYSPDGYQTG